MHIRKYIFEYALVAFILTAIVISFIKFVIELDYTVAYRVACDPTLEDCFVGCANDYCSETENYARMEKRAFELSSQCGDSVVQCMSANYCAVGERFCKKIFCNAEENDNCDAFSDDSYYYTEFNESL